MIIFFKLVNDRVSLFSLLWFLLKALSNFSEKNVFPEYKKIVYYDL